MRSFIAGCAAGPPMSVLERKLHCQLKVAWTASSKKRITDGHIWCGDGWQEANPNRAATGSRTRRAGAFRIACGRRDRTVGFKIHRESRKQGVGEVGMVEEVKGINA